MNWFGAGGCVPFLSPPFKRGLEGNREILPIPISGQIRTDNVPMKFEDLIGHFKILIRILRSNIIKSNAHKLSLIAVPSVVSSECNSSRANLKYFRFVVIEQHVEVRELELAQKT